MDNTVIQKARRKNQITLILLLLIVVGPILLAYVLTLNVDWLPRKSKNHGDIINPSRLLNDFNFTTLRGEPWSQQALQGKWTLLYFGDTACAASCQQTLYKIRQSRLAQGRHVQRIQYVYLMPTAEVPQVLSALFREHEALQVLMAGPIPLQQFSQQFQIDKQASVLTAGSVFVIDPKGQLMMHYSPTFEAKGLIKDLELLLKIQ